jgi:hypothetical protein
MDRSSMKKDRQMAAFQALAPANIDSPPFNENSRWSMFLRYLKIGAVGWGSFWLFESLLGL